MATGVLCQRCLGGQRPEVYVVSLAGTCCKCGVSELESSVCGTCQSETLTPCPCDQCTEFNGYFELPQASAGDCSRYVHEFPVGKGPCGATSIELRLTPHTDPERVNACVHIHFDQSGGPVRPVSWGKTGVGNCCEIGCLRRRSTNRKCCWPHEITVTPVPVPDFTAPQPHWLPGDPDDLNDAPFWPTLDLDLREDSPEAPIRYYNGELQLRIKDLGADGLGVPWGHTRIYSNRLSNSYDFGNGYNWLIHEQPRLVRFKTPHAKIKKFHEQEQPPPEGEPTGCTIVVLRGTRNALWFDEYAQGKSRHWHPRFGARHCLCYEGGKRCRFHLTAPNGHRWEFFDFTYPHSKALQLAGLTLAERLARVPGALVRHQGPGGQEARLTYTECRLQKVERFASPHAARSSAGVSGLVETYAYTYFPPGPHENRVRYVTLSRAGKGIARAEYLYYEQAEIFGNEGDLKLAVRQLPRDQQGEQWDNIDVHYHRYEKKPRDTYCQGMLQMVVGPEHFRRAVKKKAATNELEIIAKTPLAELAKWADDTGLIPHSPTSPLADLFIEYDKKRRVTTLSMNGGRRMHHFDYTDGFDEINYNAWRRKCIETRADARSQRVVYSSFVGRNILTCLVGDGKSWTQYRIYDIQDGALRLDTAPSGVAKFSETATVPPPSQAGAYISKAMSTQQPGQAADISGLHVEFKTSDGLFQFLDYDGSRSLSDVRVSNNNASASGFQMHHLAHYEYQVRQIGCSPNPPCWLGVSFVTKAVLRAGASKAAMTTFDYEWLGGWWTQMIKRTATLPAVRVEENGSGTPDQIIERFEAHGYREERIDERQVVTKWSYEIAKDTVKQMIEDAGPKGSPRTTDFESDDLGRTTRVLAGKNDVVTNLSPDRVWHRRTAVWHVYRDVEGEVYTAHGSVAALGGGSDEVIPPLALTRLDRAGRVTDEIEVAQAPAIWPPPASGCKQSLWSRWTRHEFDDQDQHLWTRVYHHIPASGEGVPSANYDETAFTYDALYRLQTVSSPGGTITKTTYEARGLPVRIEVGTKAELRLVRYLRYDHGWPGGNGNLTLRVDYADGTAALARPTQFSYNWCNGLAAMRRAEEPANVTFEYDFQERLTKRDEVARGYISIPQYDARGRLFRIQEHFRHGATGSYRTLTHNTWRDPAGNVIAQDRNNGQAFEKMQYDKLGRMVFHCVACNPVRSSSTTPTFQRLMSYQEASAGVSKDMIFEQSKMAYDQADNVLRATHWRRSPQADSGALGIRRGELLSEAVAPQARASRVAYWYDALGRVVAEADCGTGSFPVNPDWIPASSDALLVTRRRYNERGELYEQVDAAGSSSRTSYDDAGRVIEEVENYSWLPWPGSSRWARFTFTPDGLPRTIRASNLLTGDQVTEYVYGGSFDGLPLSTLVQSVKEPQGRLTTFTYNRQRETIWRTDANGTTHYYTYDKLGRLRNDALITLGQNIDARVHQIAYQYTGEGQLKSVTSFGGSPMVAMVNQVERGYNQFGLVTWELQHHLPAEPGSSYPLSVDYGYDVGAPSPAGSPVHGPRLATIGYPRETAGADRFAMHFDYRDQHGSGALNRVVSVAAGVPAGRPPDPVLSAIQTTAGTHWAEYTYWGLENEFGVLLPDANPASPLRHAVENLPSGPPYSRLDPFDRPRLWRWDGVSSGAHDEALYGYDRRGARTARVALATSLGQPLDEAYQYDGLARLQRVDRGKVAAGLPSGTLSTPQVAVRTFAQQWSLDQQDNWWTLLEDLDGKPGYDASEFRSHDRSNRITALWPSPPFSWKAPQYDAVGNMTRVPDLSGAGQDLTCQYDAWNRLVRVKRGSQTLAEHEYDGLGRRTVERTFTPSGNPIPRHFYYTHDWRLLEEREPAPGKLPGQVRASRRYVWGLRGPDDFLFRDRRYTGTGNLRDRLYALPDANGNITALYNPAPGSTGAPLGVVERFWYDPYGKPLYLSPTFTAKSQSDYEWNVLYGGYIYDAETGLYLVRNRVYHPLYGRWLQTDPAGFDDSYNLYQYCLGSPLTYVDPTGEELFTLGGLLIIAAMGLTGAAGVYNAHRGANRMSEAVNQGNRAEFEAGQRQFALGVVLTASAIALPVAAPIGASGGLGATTLAGATEGAIAGSITAGVTSYGFGGGAADVAISAAAGGITGAVTGAAFGAGFHVAGTAARLAGRRLRPLGSRFIQRIARRRIAHVQLYSYSEIAIGTTQPFVSSSGRVYLTSRASGKWLTERGLVAGIRRFLATGRWSPYSSTTNYFTTGPINPAEWGLSQIWPRAANFWKALGGQYHTRIGISGFETIAPGSRLLANSPIASTPWQIWQARGGLALETVADVLGIGVVGTNLYLGYERLSE